MHKSIDGIVYPDYLLLCKLLAKLSHSSPDLNQNATQGEMEDGLCLLPRRGEFVQAIIAQNC